MISVAIVEDERIERLALAQLLGEDSENVRVCWTADNGLEALEKFELECPDVMIVDISMPVMSGLELCKALSARAYGGIIIINTAYSLFNYARSAMRYGAFDYLVKPSSRIEIKEVISRSIVEIERRRREQEQQDSLLRQVSIARQCANSFLIRSMRYGEDLSAHMTSMGWPEGADFCTHILHFTHADENRAVQNSLAMAHSLIQEQQAPGILAILDSDENNSLTMLVQPVRPFPSDQCHVYLWALTLNWRRHLGFECCTVSEGCTDPLALTACYQSVCTGLAAGEENHGIFMSPYPARSLKKHSAQKLRQSLIRLFYDGQFQRCRESLRSSCRAGVSIWELAQVLLDAIDSFQEKLPDHRIWQDYLSTEGTPNENGFLEWAESLWNAMPKTSGASDGDPMIAYIYSIMQKEFNQNLTQVSIAERLGLSPAWFSKMFKQRTGENFVNALTKIRIQHAIEMLEKDPDISVEALATACGLSSKTYFCEVFHRCTGTTVRQYAKALRSKRS